jgi:hypothetical protein
MRGKQAVPLVRVAANRADQICFAVDAGATFAGALRSAELLSPAFVCRELRRRYHECGLTMLPGGTPASLCVCR